MHGRSRIVRACAVRCRDVRRWSHAAESIYSKSETYQHKKRPMSASAAPQYIVNGVELCADTSTVRCWVRACCYLRFGTSHSRQNSDHLRSNMQLSIWCRHLREPTGPPRRVVSHPNLTYLRYVWCSSEQKPTYSLLSDAVSVLVNCSTSLGSAC